MPVRIPSNRNLGPRNRRTVTVAQNAIKRVAPMAQEQYDNAIQVNGYECLIYQRLENGRKCSCSKAAKVLPTVLDEEGNATQEHINSLLTGQAFGIDEYGSQPNNKTTGNSYTSPAPNEDDFPILEEKSTNRNITPDDVNAVELEQFNDDDFILEQDAAMGSMGRCGVCFSSSYVGGYNLFNGIRLVYDTTYFDSNQKGTSKTYKATINKSQAPNTFEINDIDGYVEFDIVIPKNVIDVHFIRVFNNFDVIPQALIQIKNSSMSDFIDLNTSNVFSFATGLPCSIRISKLAVFTHVELQFAATYEDTKIEYPRITKTGDVSVIEGIDSVTLVASPKVTDLKPWDIIADGVFGKLWRVTNANLFNDNHLNNHGWDIQARLVQSYEVQSYLFVKGRKPKQTTNFNR